MDNGPVEQLISQGHTALADGQWARALELASTAVDSDSHSAEAFDLLARALWWSGRPAEAITAREKAYALHRRHGNLAPAIHAAVWLANEYEEVEANPAAANGWRARAETLMAGLPESAVHGWLSLSKATRTLDPSQGAENARVALELARRYDEPDLEIRALARLGLALVTSGRVEEGVAALDEAMAAGTGGEAKLLETIGEACCDLFVAIETVGDGARFEQWTRRVLQFMERNHYGPLVAFCGSCCGELYAAAGDVAGAEKELLGALTSLEANGHRARCIHPAAKLAELRVVQGKYEDAERLLLGYEGLPEAIGARADLALARGEGAVAVGLLERRLETIGPDSLLSVPHLARLVDAQLLVGDINGARAAVFRLQTIAETSGLLRVKAIAAISAGKMALAAEEAASEGEAITALQSAVDMFTRMHAPLEAARARLLLARALAREKPELAGEEAKTAQAALETSGAVREADAASAFLRSLGQTGKPGAKRLTVLTDREEQVLALMAEGLTNAAIADRLFISRKTADHHVSRILTKLGLKSRTEAAAYSLRRTTAGIRRI